MSGLLVGASHYSARHSPYSSQLIVQYLDLAHDAFFCFDNDDVVRFTVHPLHAHCVLAIIFSHLSGLNIALLKITSSYICFRSFILPLKDFGAVASTKSTDHPHTQETTMPRLTKKQKEAGRAKKESAKKAPTNKGFNVLPARAPRDAYLGKGELPSTMSS